MARGQSLQDPFLNALSRLVAPGGLYLTLAGNSDEPSPDEQGPPTVSAVDLVRELTGLFNLQQLRVFRFEAVLEGKEIRPLAWSALLRRKQ